MNSLLLRVNTLYLPPQSGNSDFKTAPIVQKWLFMALDILFYQFLAPISVRIITSTFVYNIHSSGNETL